MFTSCLFTFSLFQPTDLPTPSCNPHRLGSVLHPPERALLSQVISDKRIAAGTVLTGLCLWQGGQGLLQDWAVLSALGALAGSCFDWCCCLSS